MKIIKNLIVLSTILFAINLTTAQNACGNCNERYLKTVTFGGFSSFVLEDDLHVFFKLYKPNSRRCYSQNNAGDEMVSLFEAALEKNKEYQTLVDQHEAKYQRKFHRNKLVGNYIFFTANKNEVLKPYRERASNSGRNLVLHKVDAYIEGFFQNKYLCPIKTEKQKAAKSSKEDDDFWSGNNTSKSKQVTKTKQRTKSSKEDDDFWSGTTTTINNEDDFWSGTATRTSKDDSWSGTTVNTSNDNDFWSGKNKTKGAAKNDFLAVNANGEIKSENGKTGVVDTNTGRVLIPFKKWSIFGYKVGIAKVRVLLETYSKKCSSPSRVTFYGNVYKDGFVDQTGNFIGDYEVSVSSSNRNAYTGLILNVGTDNRSYAEKEAAKRRNRERMRIATRECKEGLNEWKSDMEKKYKN